MCFPAVEAHPYRLERLDKDCPVVWLRLGKVYLVCVGRKKN